MTAAAAAAAVVGLLDKQKHHRQQQTRSKSNKHWVMLPVMLHDQREPSFCTGAAAAAAAAADAAAVAAAAAALVAFATASAICTCRCALVLQSTACTDMRTAVSVVTHVEADTKICLCRVKCRCACVLQRTANKQQLAWEGVVMVTLEQVTVDLVTCWSCSRCAWVLQGTT